MSTKRGPRCTLREASFQCKSLLVITVCMWGPSSTWQVHPCYNLLLSPANKGPSSTLQAANKHKHSPLSASGWVPSSSSWVFTSVSSIRAHSKREVVPLDLVLIRMKKGRNASSTSVGSSWGKAKCCAALYWRWMERSAAWSGSLLCVSTTLWSWTHALKPQA